MYVSLSQALIFSLLGPITLMGSKCHSPGTPFFIFLFWASHCVWTTLYLFVYYLSGLLYIFLSINSWISLHIIQVVCACCKSILLCCRFLSLWLLWMCLCVLVFFSPRSSHCFFLFGCFWCHILLCLKFLACDFVFDLYKFLHVLQFVPSLVLSKSILLWYL